MAKSLAISDEDKIISGPFKIVDADDLLILKNACDLSFSILLNSLPLVSGRSECSQNSATPLSEMAALVIIRFGARILIRHLVRLENIYSEIMEWFDSSYFSGGDYISF